MRPKSVDLPRYRGHVGRGLVRVVVYLLLQWVSAALQGFIRSHLSSHRLIRHLGLLPSRGTDRSTNDFPPALREELGDAFTNITWMSHWGLYEDHPVTGWPKAHRPGKVGRRKGGAAYR